MKVRLFSSALFACGLACAQTPVDGWYSSVFGGYTYLPNNLFATYYDDFYNNANYRGGYNVGGRVGFQSTPLRYELEYTFLNVGAKEFDVNETPQDGVSGFSSANLFMANVYYDFRDVLPAVSPFLGAGIGYAYLQTSLNSTGPAGSTYFSANDSAFAYQGTAGLTFNFSENYAVNVAYRYTATAQADGIGSAFQANMVSAGGIYHFDRVDYK